MKKAYTYMIAIGTAAGAVSAVWALTSTARPLFQSDDPPWVGRTALQTVVQNFEVMQNQTQQLQRSLDQSVQTQTSLALIIYMKQREDAQAAINAAARQNRRDPVAEALRDAANLAIMKMTGQLNPP